MTLKYESGSSTIPSTPGMAGDMDKTGRKFSFFNMTDPLILESGGFLSNTQIAYETYGTLNRDRSNAILVCHALTGSAFVSGKGNFSDSDLQKAPFLKGIQNTSGWWEALIGPGKLFDTEKYFIISSNILGSCYGSTGPTSINPETGQIFGPDFPRVTVRDMVSAQYRLIQYLGIDQLAMVIGGSLGGMQVLEWGVMFPQMVRSIIPIATSARHSAWAIGLNHLAREAITNDPAWKAGRYSSQPAAGLGLARKIGMISYRSDLSFDARFGYARLSDNNAVFDPENIFQVEGYLQHQGSKLVARFDANSYLILTFAMDSHDLSRHRGDLSAACRKISAKAVCIGIDSDILYPAHEQRSIAGLIPGARYAEINSSNGHDAFLIEFDQMSAILTPLLREMIP